MHFSWEYPGTMTGKVSYNVQQMLQLLQSHLYLQTKPNFFKTRNLTKPWFGSATTVDLPKQMEKKQLDQKENLFQQRENHMGWLTFSYKMPQK